MDPHDGLSKEMVAKIVQRELVCRAVTGTVDAGGAGYALSDISGGRQFDAMANASAVPYWEADPAKYADVWKGRLWNTCGFILSFQTSGRVLIFGSSMPTAERYAFTHPELKNGNGSTFAKTNRIPSDEKALAEVTYDAVKKADLTKATIQELYDKILAAIGTL